MRPGTQQLIDAAIERWKAGGDFHLRVDLDEGHTHVEIVGDTNLGSVTAHVCPSGKVDQAPRLAQLGTNFTLDDVTFNDLRNLGHVIDAFACGIGEACYLAFFGDKPGYRPPGAERNSQTQETNNAA